MKKMQVVVVRVGQEPKVEKIDNTLADMQGIVGGYIEPVSYNKFGDDVIVVCDEEGKIKGKAYNMYLGNHDAIAGDFFVCRSNIETGSFESIKSENVEKIINAIKEDRY